VLAGARFGRAASAGLPLPALLLPSARGAKQKSRSSEYAGSTRLLWNGCGHAVGQRVSFCFSRLKAGSSGGQNGERRTRLSSRTEEILRLLSLRGTGTLPRIRSRDPRRSPRSPGQPIRSTARPTVCLAATCSSASGARSSGNSASIGIRSFPLAASVATASSVGALVVARLSLSPSGPLPRGIAEGVVGALAAQHQCQAWGDICSGHGPV
jgi:hypothetical protein